MEYVLFVLYFSFFLCLCALVCLYFSGCQEMTYRHEGKGWLWGMACGSVAVTPCDRKPLPVTALVGGDTEARREEAEGGWSRLRGTLGGPSFPLGPI